MDSKQPIVCSLFGHRIIEYNEALIDATRKALITLIENYGVNTLLVGGYGQFDELCQSIIINLHNKYTDISMVYCATDYKEQQQILRKNTTTQKYNDVACLPLTYNYWYTRIFYRNCAMIDNSQFVLFMIRNKGDSGAFKCYKYAKRTKKNIIII